MSRLLTWGFHYISLGWKVEGEWVNIRTKSQRLPNTKRWNLNWVPSKLCTQTHPPYLTSPNPLLQLALFCALPRSKLNTPHTPRETVTVAITVMECYTGLSSKEFTVLSSLSPLYLYSMTRGDAKLLIIHFPDGEIEIQRRGATYQSQTAGYC